MVGNPTILGRIISVSFKDGLKFSNQASKQARSKEFACLLDSETNMFKYTMANDFRRLIFSVVESNRSASNIENNQCLFQQQSRR